MAAAGAVLLAGLSAGGAVRASGVSPYLPLNLSPDIERKVERVLILAGAPVMRRPVPIARVLAALPAACERDRQLCTEVRHYLDRYFHTVAVTHAGVEVAAANDAHAALPDAHGERIDSPADASAVASYRPFDHLLLSAGAVAYAGTDARFNPDGTMLSVGNQYLQIDAGYRDQWLSPLTDSSMLISTQAPTMPSLTLSSQMPMGPAGFEYQLFVARMSRSALISWRGGYTAGNPRLAGVHLGVQPAPGWAIAGNALYQYGGGARPHSFSGLFDFVFHRTVLGDDPAAATDSRFANREVSITSSYTFPGRTPLETYVEYAGRDSFHGELYRFHETALSAGVHIPELFGRFDLTLEASEWQNGWYTDYVWQDGMTVDHDVIGHWGASWRNFDNAAGAHSAMAQLGFALRSGDQLDLRYRMLQNEAYADAGYRLAQMLSVEYAQPRNGYTRGLSLDGGRDAFGAGFIRVAAFLRLDGGNQGMDEDSSADYDDEDADDDAAAGQAEEGSGAPRGLERFVDLGVSGGKLGLDLGGFSAADEAAPAQYRDVGSPHLGVGLRRAITQHADLGVRLELDDFDGLMVALRVADFRYRFGKHLSAGVFGGFARYSGPTPAQGYYGGVGLTWRNLFGHWDLSLDDRFFNALQRDKVLPSDQAAAANGDPVEWYVMRAPSLYLSHRF
jgi:hypothetical protein